MIVSLSEPHAWSVFVSRLNLNTVADVLYRVRKSESEGSFVDADAVKLACVTYRPQMVTACYHILGNSEEAKEATNQAVVNALNNLPREPVKDWCSWLCKIARNASYDLLRKKIPARQRWVPFDSLDDRAQDEQSSECDNRADAQRLVRLIRQFLGEDKNEDVDRYLAVVLRIMTEEELAADEKVPREWIKRRRDAIRTKIRDAAVAVYLIDNPGKGENRCEVPTRKAADRARSPELLAEIMTHVAKCDICGCKRRNPSGLLRTILVILGVGFTASMTTGKKVAVAAAVIGSVTAGSMVFLTEQPDAAPIASRPPVPVLMAPRPTEPDNTAPIPAPPAPRSTKPGPGSSSPALPAGPTTEPPTRAPQEPPRVSSPNVETSSPGRAGFERDDSPPTISSGWIEHRRIATSEHGTCHGAPRVSKVRAMVTAPSGVAAVTMHLRTSGRDWSFPMTNSAGAWHGRFGPMSDEDTHGRYDVVITAVDVHGLQREQRIGVICITDCRAAPSE